MAKSANIGKVKAMASRAQARTKNAHVGTHPARKAAASAAVAHSGKLASSK